MNFLDTLKVLPNPLLWIQDIGVAFDYLVIQCHSIAAFVARLVDSCPPFLRIILGFAVTWTSIIAVMNALKRL